MSPHRTSPLSMALLVALTAAALTALALPHALMAQPDRPAADQVEVPRPAQAETAAPRQPAADLLARARSLAGSADGTNPEELEEAGRLFASSAAQAQGKLRVEAHNNWGVFLLRLGEHERAAEVFRDGMKDLGTADLDDTARSRYLYNYGAALERTAERNEADWIYWGPLAGPTAKRNDGAETAYWRAVKLDPGFMPACDALFRLLSTSSWGDGGQVANLIELLIEGGNVEGAGRYLRSYAGSGFRNATVPLAHYLAAAAPSLPEFRESWEAEISRSIDILQAGEDIDRDRLRQILAAYTGELPLLLQPEAGEAFARPWQGSPETAAAYSRLLKAAGDAHLRESQAVAALPRYALAWTSAGNFDAVVYLAGLLQNAREQVDPEGRVLDQLITILFEGKGNAYLRGDWENILRFHTVLAEIFERQGRWGSSGDPRSAVFQLERALAARRRLGGSPGPVPGLHARLANAYRAAGRPADALPQYLEAAEQYVALSRPEAARPLLLRLEELAPGAGGEQGARLAALRTAAAPTPRPLDDGDITAVVSSMLAADPENAGDALQVTTKKGVVTLSGQVKDRKKLGEIEKLVRSVGGVSKVRSEVRVAGVEI